METQTYRVLRDHIGPEGQLFSPSGNLSLREAIPHEVAHLVPLTLELIDAAPETAANDQGGADTVGAGVETDGQVDPVPDAATENKAEAAPETAAVITAPARKGK